jgi:hypothetical protein
MHHVAPAESLPERCSRAPLKHPVRVTIAGERVVRVLSGDISANGMFLMMADPPEPGTVVTMAFEAGGKVLPFAEGEVAWRRSQANGGFGVRFTRYLHPRARALVDYLSENVEHGTTLKTPPPVRSARRWSGLAVAAALVAFLVTWSQPPAPAAPLEAGQLCLPEAKPVEPSESLASLVSVVPEPVVAVKKPAPPRRRPLPETPRPGPTLARTIASAVNPGPFSSTPIPSGAARLVNVSRVSGSLRVAIDVVAGGRVSNVATLQNPARLVIDVTGLPPVTGHVVSLDDSELRRITVGRQGAGTRLIVDLVRLPTRVVQQGDSALITF